MPRSHILLIALMDKNDIIKIIIKKLMDILQWNLGRYLVLPLWIIDIGLPQRPRKHCILNMVATVPNVTSIHSGVGYTRSGIIE